MECKNFAEIACDLARDALMESGLRNSALEHASYCRECGIRLAAERALNQALAFAAEAEIECAPPSVKLAIEKAFRGQPASAKASRHSRETTGTKAVGMRRFVQVAAAVLLILFVAMAFYMIRSRGATPGTAGPGSSGPVAGNTPKPGEGLRAPGPAATTENDREPVTSGPLRGRRSLKPRLAYFGTGGPAEPRWESKVDSEAMTDFIPLTYLTRSTAIESGQVMRVRVPLSTFIALGVPINAQHADELVNAEVIVGDDGVQRAVRLIK